MRISELVERSGVSAAAIDSYIRDGLVPPGSTGRDDQVEYDESHLRRLTMIRALVDLRGIPLERVRGILAVIDDLDQDPVSTISRAVDVLPPHVDGRADSYPHAHALVERLGWTWRPGHAATRQLEKALSDLDSAGLRTADDRYDALATALRETAIREITDGPDSPEEFLSYAILSTVLIEPVILALRRLALQDVALRGPKPGSR